jgi:hypothetical protein
MNIMEFTLLRLDTVTKSSPISEGVTEIWINIHLARENKATWHMWGLLDPTKRPQFATMIKESGRVSLFSSACLPRDTTHWAIRGCPVHYFGIHHCRRGEVSSNSSTFKGTKFAGPNKFRMRQYIINACYTGPNWHGP